MTDDIIPLELDLDLEMLNEPSSGWAGKIALQNLL
jgi:hypothetical protein